ncbi:MAG TPA: hypothetical protein VHA52_02395 [Candidatus Babeliaceae bacterium]|nr:hypothetical protein [Candidatus Babeliaceae bacterium]
MAAKRHHHERITKHDRMVDRENLHRHHMKKQSEHSRYKEHSGEERYLHGYYEGPHERRRQEMEDGGMIREDHAEIANMPQEVMIKPYPKTGPSLPEEIDDTIRGIDRQMDEDDSQRRKHFRPHKY